MKILIILLIILALFLLLANKVNKSLIKTGKYVYKSKWLELTITIENE